MKCEMIYILFLLCINCTVCSNCTSTKNRLSQHKKRWTSRRVCHM